MPAEITTPSTTGAVDRLALGTEAVRGGVPSTIQCTVLCNCAEFEATPSAPGTGPCNGYCSEID